MQACVEGGTDRERWRMIYKIQMAILVRLGSSTLNLDMIVECLELYNGDGAHLPGLNNDIFLQYLQQGFTDVLCGLMGARRRALEISYPRIAGLQDFRADFILSH